MALAALLLPSCVSKKKFRASEARVWELKQDSTELAGELRKSRGTVYGLQQDSAMLAGEKMNVEEELRALAARSNTTIAEQTRRLKALEDLLQAQRNTMNNLRKTVADALVKYKKDDLSVYIKDGNVYVSLQEKLLFESGKAMVDPKGREALSSLAEVLKSTSNISIMVEGHTDTVPIKTAKYADNWDLSVARANAIVRILTDDYGVDPHLVTAAGHGPYFPVDTNTTPEGRANNRRTEIIISPDLKELFDVLYLTGN